MHRFRALTLPELLIYVSLTGLVTILVCSQVINVLKHSQRLQQRDDRHKAVQLAMQRILHDLHQSRPEAIGLSADPVILAIHRWQFLQDDGTLVWEPEHRIYSVQGQNLLRQSWRPEPELKMLTADRLREVVNQTLPGRKEILARQVLHFEVTPNQRDQGLLLPIVCRLRLGSSDKPQEQVEARRVVMLR